jgi:hypothetical protein
MGPVAGQLLAYSAARQRLIAFGTTDQYVTETWEWDGSSWTQLADTGPKARFASAMTCDSDRDVVVLFGGNLVSKPAASGPGNGSDTWEWNGAEWTQREDQGPEGRRGHAMAYDAARKQTVLFGGASVRPELGFPGIREFGDTWVWNGQSWRQAAGFGPSKRCLHSMAYDDALGQTVLFGGVQPPSKVYFGDTWEWDGKRWAQFQDIGPSGRYDAKIAYDSSRKCMVLFGGGGNSLQAAFTDAPFFGTLSIALQLNDTWELSERLLA